MNIRSAAVMIAVFVLLGGAGYPAAKKKEMPKKSLPMAEGILLDGFEANDWIASYGEGAEAKMTVVPGMEYRALRIDYDLTDNRQWIQINKEVPIDQGKGEALQFYLKSSGKNVNNLEVKLVDDDGTNFGYRIPLDLKDEWKKVTVPFTDFTYWWGGNEVLDNAYIIYFAISSQDGKKGRLVLDDLRLVKLIKTEEKKVNKIRLGLIDACETLEGWSIEGEEGTTHQLVTIPGKKELALGIEYDLTKGNWVQASKPFPIQLNEGLVFRFYMKWSGEQNILEFKVSDKDGTTFGKRFEDMKKPDKWQKIEIPVTDLTYWWGGDDKLDMVNIDRIWIALSKSSGGKGLQAIDHLELIEQ